MTFITIIISFIGVYIKPWLVNMAPRAIAVLLVT